MTLVDKFPFEASRESVENNPILKMDLGCSIREYGIPFDARIYSLKKERFDKVDIRRLMEHEQWLLLEVISDSVNYK
jgi:hypothetical protein